MAAGTERLLQSEQGASDDNQRLWRKPRISKTWLYWSVGSLAGVSLVVFASQDRASSQITSNDEVGTFDWGTSKCYKYSGASCSEITGDGTCPASRQSECSSFGYCWCPNGCVGSDGHCYSNVTEYKLVAKKIKFRNMYWTDQYLYAPHYGGFMQLRTAAKKYSWYAFEWDIYELPGNMYHTGKPGYFISPHQYPGYVAAVATSNWAVHIPGTGPDLDAQHHQINGGTTIPVGSQYVVDTYSTNPPLGPYSPDLLVNHICTPREHPDEHAVEIWGAFGKIPWYLHMFSWLVYGYSFGDAGQQGYWVVEPPIQHQFPLCPRSDD